MSDSERGTQHCQTSTVDSPTQQWSSLTSCSVVCSFHPVQYSQRKFLPRSKSERGSINYVQAPHSKIVNQPVRAPTTQSSIVSSDGVSETEKLAVSLVRVKESQMPSRTNPVLAQQRQRVSVRAFCIHGTPHTQQRHSMSESEEALSLAQGNTTILPVGIKSHSW